MQKPGKSQFLLILQGELQNKFKDDLYILQLDKIAKKIDMMLADVKDALLQYFNCGRPSVDLLLQLSKNFNCERKDIENMFVSFKKHVEIETNESIDSMLKHTKNEVNYLGRTSKGQGTRHIQVKEIHVENDFQCHPLNI